MSSDSQKLSHFIELVDTIPLTNQLMQVLLPENVHLACNIFSV